MTPINRNGRAGWNAFRGRDPTDRFRNFLKQGYNYTSRPEVFRSRLNNARTVVAKIYNRLALDAASITILHAKVDENGNYVETIDDGLNECLTINANIDQTGMFFIKSAVQMMFDEGTIALIPIDTDKDPTTDSDQYKIFTMRVGRILSWYPQAVELEAYNEETGQIERLVMPKTAVAIVENPYYPVMNEPNSTLQQLLRTIRQLDAYNSQNTSGKLDLIIQLPYGLHSPKKQEEAKRRREELEEQMDKSKLGIGYIDGTEKIVQLNRSLENNLWTQVKELTTQLYSELGLTQAIIDGTADEQTYINYFQQTISPICKAITDELTRKFLSKKARTQGQRVIFYRDPFKLIPLGQLGELSDSLRRNEIMSTNEIRAKIGMRPIANSEADDIRNPNLNKAAGEPNNPILTTDERDGGDTGEEMAEANGTQTPSAPAQNASVDINALTQVPLELAKEYVTNAGG